MTTPHRRPEEPTLVGVFPYADEEAVTFVQNEGTIYPLTTCCLATATGTEFGTACRACYEEIDSRFGACWTTEEWSAEAIR